jgi:hypothetical protein
MDRVETKAASYQLEAAGWQLFFVCDWTMKACAPFQITGGS